MRGPNVPHVTNRVGATSFSPGERTHQAASANGHSVATLQGEGAHRWRQLWAGGLQIGDAFQRCGVAFILAHYRRASPCRPLTEREAQVATLVASGCSNKLVGHELSIRASTVSTHLGSLRDKFCVSSRAELVDVLRRWQRGIQPGAEQVGKEGRRRSPTPESLGLPRCAPDGLLVVPMQLRDGLATLFSYPLQNCPRVSASFSLTPAQRSIADMLLRGHSYGSIAQLRGSSPGTVRKQVEHIYRRVGVHSVGELAVALDPAVFP